jgi:hypothetical protein
VTSWHGLHIVGKACQHLHERVQGPGASRPACGMHNVLLSVVGWGMQHMHGSLPADM